MKVLQLGKFYPIRGGVEKVMWDLTRGLAERGVDCDMLCAMLREADFDEVDKPRSSADGRIRTISFGPHGRCICVPAYRKVAATMMSPSMVAWLRKHCGEYDIIHVHHPDPMACLALRLSGYRGRVILHWHSDILKQKGLLKLYLPLQRWLIGRAEKIVGTTPVYVEQSPWLQEVKDKLCFLPIGIEDDIRSAAGSVRVPGETIRLFSLGRLVEYKGFEYLIDAMRYLPESYTLEIGGKGPLREALQARIEDAGLGERVKLLGFLSDGEAHALYNTCDVFVLSSVMKTEAFGIVQIEAMSCAKPVIATHIPGSGTDWVNADGVSGINVPCCDAKAIADAVLKICGSDYASYSRGARERFEELFTFDAMIDGCLKIYENEI